MNTQLDNINISIEGISNILKDNEECRCPLVISHEFKLELENTLKSLKRARMGIFLENRRKRREEMKSMRESLNLV